MIGEPGESGEPDEPDLSGETDDPGLPEETGERAALRVTVTPRGLAPRWLAQGLARRLRRAARRLGVDPAALPSLAIHLVDDPAIARLNAEHMGKTGPTDVLSFPAGAAPGGPLLGDVVISVDAVRRQARARLGLPTDVSQRTGTKRQVLWGVVVETGSGRQVWPDMVQGTAEAAAALDEVTVLAVHGLCHLLGHDHGRPAEARAMHRRERGALRAAATPDVPRPYGLRPERTRR